jgi:hypothetical protein
MKTIYYGGATFLIGDEAADVLVEYAVQIASSVHPDAVDLHVLGPDGNEEIASFVLTPATMVTAETNRSELPEPDNTESVARIRQRLEHLRHPPMALPFPEDLIEVELWDDV